MAWLHPSWFFLFLFDRRKDGGCWSIPVSLTSPLRYRICCVILWFRDDLAGCGVCPDQSAHVQHWARTSEARQICQVLGCLFLFSRIYLWGPKNRSWQDSWGYLFSCVFRRNFHRNVVLERLQEFRFFSILQEFFVGIPVGRNSCIYSGFLWNPEDSCSYRKLSGSGQRQRRLFVKKNMD